MLKKLLRSRPVLRAAGLTMAGYLKFVRRTNRLIVEPADAEETIYSQQPVIVAMWHGQHFMIPFMKRPQDEVSVMISRHGDGEINAIAVEALGIRQPCADPARSGRIRSASGGARRRCGPHSACWPADARSP